MSDHATELLFSYGILQFDAVQVETFGRLLDGRHDPLPAYIKGVITIDDAAVVATSGTAEHPMIRRSSRADDCVEGMVFALTPQELAQADTYEVEAYKRVAVRAQSGDMVWAYVDANDADDKD